MKTMQVALPGCCMQEMIFTSCNGMAGATEKDWSLFSITGPHGMEAGCKRNGTISILFPLHGEEVKTSISHSKSKLMGKDGLIFGLLREDTLCMWRGD